MNVCGRDFNKHLLPHGATFAFIRFQEEETAGIAANPDREDRNHCLCTEVAGEKEDKEIISVQFIGEQTSVA